MLSALLALVVGLIVLLVSAHYFVVGTAAGARHFGMPPLLIGMVVVGFGTSAPEMVVSVLAAHQGNPGIALGNAYGSNIVNIALILGLTALIRPVNVPRPVLHRELPILLAVTVLAAWQAWDDQLTRIEALVLLLVFTGLMLVNICQALHGKHQALEPDLLCEMEAQTSPFPAEKIGRAMVQLFTGLIFLILSSRVLVWAAVAIARNFAISEVVIGLTIVAIGTSLPELASSLVAARKGEHDIALGNILGSNLFNTLAVVGIAAAIQPMPVDANVLGRDILLMATLTASLLLLGWTPRHGEGPGRINRLEGALLVSVYLGYTLLLLRTITTA
ncbi:MAG: calcium/sodium antiporter [Desulfobulbaceae bacterium]|nr:calcium/sodium antiporter [Desulfobulbaceae bacterium]